MPRCFTVHPQDNVATLLDDVTGPVPVEILGLSNPGSIAAHEPIALGHKIALRLIRNGEAVIKFGVPIGRATRDVQAGDWVHLHNCASLFDQRSGTLDVHTGAVTDTKYE